MLRCTQSSLLGRQDLAGETQHREHHFGESPWQPGILPAVRCGLLCVAPRGLGTKGSSGSQGMALPDTAGHTPSGFASPAGVAPAAQPGLGSGDDPEGFPQQGATFSTV